MYIHCNISQKMAVLGARRYWFNWAIEWVSFVKYQYPPSNKSIHARKCGFKMWPLTKPITLIEVLIWCTQNRSLASAISIQKEMYVSVNVTFICKDRLTHWTYNDTIKYILPKRTSIYEWSFWEFFFLILLNYDAFFSFASVYQLLKMGYLMFNSLQI